MLDRTIPFYNTILRCDHYRHTDLVLPESFSIVPYQTGYEKAWAGLEYSVGDFASFEEAESYFKSAYLRHPDRTENLIFLLNEGSDVIGSCIAWQDKRGDSLVSSLHWLIVDDQYQGKGLGKALCCAVMNLFEEQSGLPVYVHTQPWSWKAILLYHSLGFRLQKNDTFSHYENEYAKAMDVLQQILDKKQFDLLQELSEN